LHAGGDTTSCFPLFSRAAMIRCGWLESAGGPAFFVAAARVATLDVLLLFWDCFCAGGIPSVAVSAAGLCRDTRGMISGERTKGGNKTTSLDGGMKVMTMRVVGRHL